MFHQSISGPSKLLFQIVDVVAVALIISRLCHEHKLMDRVSLSLVRVELYMHVGALHWEDLDGARPPCHRASDPGDNFAGGSAPQKAIQWSPCSSFEHDQPPSFCQWVCFLTQRSLQSVAPARRRDQVWRDRWIERLQVMKIEQQQQQQQNYNFYNQETHLSTVCEPKVAPSMH